MSVGARRKNMTEHINMHEIINDNIVNRLYGLEREDLKLR